MLITVKQIHIRVIGAIIAIATLAGIALLADAAIERQDLATQEQSATRR